MCWLQSLDTNPYLHSGERCGVFGLARVATSKGGVKVNKWLDSHSYGAMWHLCCKHSEDVFYACRISLISGLLNEDLICWVGS